MEKRILEVLARFASLEQDVLKDEVLRGQYSAAAEQEFDRALLTLRDRGAIGAGSNFGPFWIRPGRSAAHTRA